ncbi:hypothetical protein POG09_16085, partial [Coprococcus comes]|uniref:hypothetical protein n=1 Tax=Coprococcus comes TaxID=410072 RepID=UPI00232E40AB
IKDNMANMCAKVTSTYMEFTLAFGPKLEFSFSFKYHFSQTHVPLLYISLYRTYVLKSRDNIFHIHASSIYSNSPLRLNDI